MPSARTARCSRRASSRSRRSSAKKAKLRGAATIPIGAGVPAGPRGKHLSLLTHKSAVAKQSGQVIAPREIIDSKAVSQASTILEIVAIASVVSRTHLGLLWCVVSSANETRRERCARNVVAHELLTRRQSGAAHSTGNKHRVCSARRAGQGRQHPRPREHKRSAEPGAAPRLQRP